MDVWGALTPKCDKGGEVTSQRLVVFGWCGPAEEGATTGIAADLRTFMGSSLRNGIIAWASFPGLPQGLNYFSAAMRR